MKVKVILDHYLQGEAYQELFWYLQFYRAFIWATFPSLLPIPLFRLPRAENCLWHSDMTEWDEGCYLELWRKFMRKAFWKLRIFLNQVLKAVAVGKARLLRSRWRGQLLPLLGQSGVGRWETLLLLMHKKTGRMMWFPLACMNSSVMLSLLPSFSQPYSPPPPPFLSPATPSQEEQKTQGPLPGPTSWVHS